MADIQQIVDNYIDIAGLDSNEANLLNKEMLTLADSPLLQPHTTSTGKQIDENAITLLLERLCDVVIKMEGDATAESLLSTLETAYGIGKLTLDPSESDELTGLKNKTAIKKWIQQVATEASKQTAPVAQKGRAPDDLDMLALFTDSFGSDDAPADMPMDTPRPEAPVSQPDEPEATPEVAPAVQETKPATPANPEAVKLLANIKRKGTLAAKMLNGIESLISVAQSVDQAKMLGYHTTALNSLNKIKELVASSQSSNDTASLADTLNQINGEYSNITKCSSAIQKIAMHPTAVAPQKVEETPEEVAPSVDNTPAEPTQDTAEPAIDTSRPEMNEVKPDTASQPAPETPTADVAAPTAPEETVPEAPVPETPKADEAPAVDNRTKYKAVYDRVDAYAMSKEQADMAKKFVDIVLAEPDNPKFARAYKALTGRPGAEQTNCICGLLTQADPKLGFRDPKNMPADASSPFTKGTVTQSRNGATAQNALVVPTGFGQKKNTVMWNTPVIMDFGFPFLNFSSDAMLNIIKSKETDENIKNANLKSMFKEAAKKLGGIWKAIYASPLALLRQIASERGTKCTPNYIKIDGNELIESESGDGVSVYPIKYYSVEPEYEPTVRVPRDFLSSFYEVMDYSTSSRKTYMKYAYGMSADDFAEETDENGGVPPFYILVPKAGKFSKCDINPGSLLGSLLNLILGRKKCTMVKTMFMGKRGCLAMESDVANKLYSDT